MVETKLNMNWQCAVIFNKSGNVLHQERGQQIKGNYCSSVLGTDEPPPATLLLGPLVSNKSVDVYQGGPCDLQGEAQGMGFV